MKDFVRFAFLCLLAWIALPGAKAELADRTQNSCPVAIFRSLQAARLAAEVLARHSFLPIRSDDSSDLELEAKGHKLTMHNGFSDTFGGGQAVMRDYAAGVNYGASDPRKDGVAVPELPIKNWAQ